MKYEDLPRDGKTKAILVEEAEFPVRYTLLTPLAVQGADCAALDIREPVVADLELARKESGGLAQSIRLLSAVADIAPDDVRRMATRDFARLCDLMDPFM